MPITTKLVSILFAGRRNQIERFVEKSAEVQAEQLSFLLEKAADTLYGNKTGIGKIRSAEEYARKIPIVDYETLSPYIAMTKSGIRNVLWPSEVKWFAKSSGTTDAKSKFIPVTDDGLKHMHLRGPRDVIAFFTSLYPESNVFKGKTLTLGGSMKIEQEGETAFSGDLSAILLKNTPLWANLWRVPQVDTALIPDFEEKVSRICEESVKEYVTSFAGVPSWNLVMLEKVLEYTGKQNLLEVWPGLELFIHGGMNFDPYRKEYERIIPSADMKYMETYNASEGFFAISNKPGSGDMLLMLDYHTYYEFLPMETLGDHTTAVPLEGVRTGVNYAMIITSSNGLWRYMLGDTVVFTSVSPYCIKISGRTKHFINAFGEEVVVENAEYALAAACEKTGARVSNYTVAPVYMEEGKKGSHEWVVEFAGDPASRGDFARALDESLQEVNSDYAAKRFRDTTLMPPVLTPVAEGTFMEWMKERGKIGGQNKVPRLFNDRTYVEQLKSLDQKTNNTNPKMKIPCTSP